MRTTEMLRTNATKIFASVLLVGGAATVAGMGTFGAYTDTTSADVSVSSGTVKVLMNDSDQGVHLDAARMVPGDSVVFPVTIKRAADSVALGDLTLATKITNQNALTDALRLSVDTCTKPWTVSANAVTCTGTSYSVSRDSTLIGNGSTTSWGQTRDWVPTLNGNSAVYVRATLSLPATASNATSGLSTGITWTLTGSQRTGTTTVVTPTAS